MRIAEEAAQLFAATKWASLTVEACCSGRYAEIGVRGFDENAGALGIKGLSFATMDVVDDIRAKMYEPDRGTWFGMFIRIEKRAAAGVAPEARFVFDQDPGFQILSPEGFLEDQKVFPRSRDHVPDWLNELLERAVAEQVAAGEKPSTAVPWLTGATPAGGGGRLARWGRSVADKVTGRSAATHEPVPGAASPAPSADAAAVSQVVGAGGLVAGAGTGSGTSVGAAGVPGPVAEVAALVPEPLRVAWLATAAPSVALHRVDDAPDTAASGAAGKPMVVVGGDTVDLPAGSSWPTWRDRPFQLHAVVDCDAARALQPALTLPAGKVTLFAPPAGALPADSPAGTAVVHLPPGAPTTTVTCPDGVPVLPRVELAGTAQDSYDSLDLLALDLHTTDPDHPALAGLTGMAALTGTDDGGENEDDMDDGPLDDGGDDDGVITDADELFETASDALPPPDLAGRIGGWPDPTGSRPHQDLADAGPATTPPWTLLLQLTTTDPSSDDVHYWLTPTTAGGGNDTDGLTVHHITQH